MAFDIIFRGDIVVGHNIQDVKARLQQLFKVDAARVDALFSGGVVTLKRNLDEASAKKYQTVLVGAGAQVELRPAAAEPPSRRKPATAGAASPAATGLSVAPPGSDLLKSSERRAPAEQTLDLSAYSLRPMEGELLDPREKAPTAAAPALGADFDLAEAGADLNPERAESGSAVPEIDADFSLAEPGADLLPADSAARTAPVEVDTSHLQVLPPEE